MKVIFGQTEKTDLRIFGCKVLDRVIIDAYRIDVDDDSFAIRTLQVSLQLG
jgi:hypothetical protein